MGCESGGLIMVLPSSTRRLQPSVERWKEQLELYGIMLPALAVIFLFCYVPIYGLIISFQDYYPGRAFFALDGTVKWVGLKHFYNFTTSRVFWRLILLVSRTKLADSAIQAGYCGRSRPHGCGAGCA